MYEKSLKYINMGFTGMFSVETVLKIIGFGVKVSDSGYEYSLMGKLATSLAFCLINYCLLLCIIIHNLNSIAL